MFQQEKYRTSCNEPFHTEKAIKANGKDLRLASNQKLTLNKCSSTIIVPIGLKTRKNQNRVGFFLKI